jgi:hypothetical protein
VEGKVNLLLYTGVRKPLILLVEGKVNLLLYTGVRKPLIACLSAFFLGVVLGMQFRSAQSEFAGEIEFRMKLEVRGIENLKFSIHNESMHTHKTHQHHDHDDIRPSINTGSDARESTASSARRMRGLRLFFFFFFE